MKARKWATEYGVGIGLTVLFAAVLGHLPLFRETSVGKLHASDLVQFLGYGGALAIIWLSARRLSDDPPEDWKWLTPFRALILPLAALITTALAYSVLLLICEPFLSKAAKSIYNWMFITGIVGSTAWLVFTWIQRCAPLVGTMEPKKVRKAA